MSLMFASGSERAPHAVIENAVANVRSAESSGCMGERDAIPAAPNASRTVADCGSLPSYTAAMRTLGWIALALMGCGPGTSWNDAGDVGPDVRPTLTTAEMALVGTWARDAMPQGTIETLHIIETFNPDHTARLTFAISSSCGMAATSVIDRHWSVDSGLLVLDPSPSCTVTNTSDACSVTDAHDYCTAPQIGGMVSYSVSGNMLTIDPGTGEGGSYTRQ